MSNRLCVVLAAYNGENYIDSQLKSVYNNLSQDDLLVIIDDKSNDGTGAICQRFAAGKYNVIYERNEINMGCARNFINTLRHDEVKDCSYVAFSDQDDIWEPNKIDRALALFPSSDIPFLYYSNVDNYDENCENRLYRVCQPELSKQISASWVTGYFYPRALGCTFVFNRQLALLASRNLLDSYPRLHDGWIHSLAMLTGNVYFDSEYSGIKRRISPSNLTSPKDGFTGKIKAWKNGKQAPFANEAKLLLNVYEDVLSEDRIEFLRALSSIPESTVQRFNFLRRYMPVVSLDRRIRYCAKTLSGRL